MVKKRKLRWVGHASMSSGLAKTILQGTVNGKRRGRQKKRWEDNIKEWTGMDFVSSTRAAEDRTKWKGKCVSLLNETIHVLCCLPAVSPIVSQIFPLQKEHAYLYYACYIIQFSELIPFKINFRRAILHY